MDNWGEIIISDKKYLVSSYYNKNEWKIMVTDFRELFTALLTKEQVINKCQEMNPLLSNEELDMSSISTDLLTKLPDYLSKDSSISKLELRKKIQDGIFKFSVDLLACEDRNEFFEVITRPLCLTIVEMSKENKIIRDLIFDKDEEIKTLERDNDVWFRLSTRTEEFDRNDLPKVNSTYDQDTLFQEFRHFFWENEGLFRKVYVKDDEKAEENKEEAKDGANQSDDNEIAAEKKITAETSKGTDGNQVVENVETKKEKPKKHPVESKTPLRSSKRIKRV